MNAAVMVTVAAVLSGYVVDAITNEPVPGATVVLPVRGHVTLTDDRGYFFFDVPSARYDVVASATGYETLRLLDVPFQGDPSAALRLRLTPVADPADTSAQVFQVGEVAVTASRTTSRTVETPREIRVVDEVAISDQMPAGTPEALREVPEVLVQKSSLGGGSPIMRGLSGNRVLLMVDGVRLNNSTYRVGLNQYLNTVDSGIVERVEVVPGPGSVLYGSDALGGVVNVMTVAPHADRPLLRYAGKVSAVEGSSTNSLQLSRWWGSGGLLFGASYRDFADLRGGGLVGTQIPTGYDEWSANGRLRLTAGRRGEFTLAYQTTHQRDVPRTDRVVAGKDSVYTYDPQVRELLLARYEWRGPTPWLQYARLTGSWNHQREGRNIISSSDTNIGQRFLDDTQTLGFSAEARSLIGHRTLFVYGAEGYYDRVNSEGELTDRSSGEATAIPGKFPDDGEYYQAGAFVQGERFVSGTASLIVALRYSMFRLTGTPQGPFGRVAIDNHIVTGSVQSRLKTGDDDYVFLGVAQAFRAPNMEDALSTGLSNKGYDVPNPELKPERSLNLEAGLKTSGVRMDPDRWRTDEPGQAYTFNATLYATFIQDLVERVPTTFEGSDSLNGEPVFHNGNLGRAFIAGATFAGSWQFWRHWTVLASGAITFGENVDLDVPLTRIPPARANVTVRRDLGPAWIAFVVDMAARQDRLSPEDLRDTRIPEGGTPGYVVPSLRAGLRIGRTVYLRGSLANLTDVAYKTHGSGIYQSGRNVILGLEVQGWLPEAGGP